MPLALAWVYYAWKGVPFEVRGDVTPGTAVGYMFIPFYNLKWMFDVNTRLCDALEEYLTSHGETYPSPRSWAIYAATAHLVASFIGIVVTLAQATRFQFVVVGMADVLWFTYAFRCDGLRRAVVRATRRDEHWGAA